MSGRFSDLYFCQPGHSRTPPSRAPRSLETGLLLSFWVPHISPLAPYPCPCKNKNQTKKQQNKTKQKKRNHWILHMCFLKGLVYGQSRCSKGAVETQAQSRAHWKPRRGLRLPVAEPRTAGRALLRWVKDSGWTWEGEAGRESVQSVDVLFWVTFPDF